MDDKGCEFNDKMPEKTCLTCSDRVPLLYWCETCQRLVAEKRCPGCGLKSRKVRQPE